MSDLKDSSLAYQPPPSASAPAAAPAAATKPKPLSLYSLTSFAVLCALAYLAYDAFLPPGSSHGTGFGLLSASSPSSHRAAESPSANAPYLPSSSLSQALPANIAGPSCRLLPNAHSDRFYTSVCCDLRPRAADDDAPGATLWLVRNATLGQGAEDLRIKAHGVAKPDRTGRQMASSKLDRPEVQADGLTYRYDFVIPPPPTTDAELETFVAPTLNVWFQTSHPIIDISSKEPKRYARLFDESVDLSALACARPPAKPMSARFARR